ncbi:MAG TPA: TonB-dependent receptor plug domain-containing protein [Panacibacter sp.]|nr:TonB-dependent receptor plug domain-containing protein [Panacibacter sp.]
MILRLRRTLVRLLMPGGNAKLLICFAATLLPGFASYAQNADSASISADSSSLQNVTVTAFAAHLKWKDVPASAAVLSKQNLQRFDGNSLVPAMNTVPGVRMEERSPGSYRLSVRGSLLRSPFGVRNVKVYWDDVPLTDATGNTYINLIDVSNLQSVEIIKGPSASFYGANTGGAIVLHSDDNIPYKKNSFNAAVSGGSFGLFSQQAGWRCGDKKFISNLQQSHIQNDGYRQQSALRKGVVKWNSKWNINANESLSFLAFYTDLHYETPGGLTQAQFDLDPKLASQPLGSFPGAVAKAAAVFNTTYFAGASLHSSLTKGLSNTTSFVINHSNFINPTTRNYEIRKEWNYSGRTDFSYRIKGNGFAMQANAGGELQYNDSYIRDFSNVNGNADTIQLKDKIDVTQYFLFAQLNMNIGTRLLLQAGISRNDVRYWYDRMLDHTQEYPQIKKAGPTVSPRFIVVLVHIGLRLID